MAKKKEPFIKRNLRPDLEINLGKKIGELTVRELTSILGYDRSSEITSSANLLGPIIKRYLDSKQFKDFKDNKDDIHEGPLNLKNNEKLLEKIIKRISGLENEVKKLKKK